MLKVPRPPDETEWSAGPIKRGARSRTLSCVRGATKYKRPPPPAVGAWRWGGLDAPPNCWRKESGGLRPPPQLMQWI